MSRRTGLGRGLAALIPPSQPEDDRGEQQQESARYSEPGNETGGDNDPDNDPDNDVVRDPRNAPHGGHSPAHGDVQIGAPAGTVGSRAPQADRGETDAPLSHLPSPPAADATAAEAASQPSPPPQEDISETGASETEAPAEPSAAAHEQLEEGGSPFRREPDPGAIDGSSGPVAPDREEAELDDRHPPQAEPTRTAAGIADEAPPPIGDDALSVVTSSGPARPSATLAEVSPDDIIPNPRQPREVFDEEEIEGLAVSLIDVGVLQPLVVRPLAGGGYELVAGERRLRAAKVAGLELIPVVVRHTEDADLLKEALVENIHRVQLNPLEEAAAYQQLLDEFGFTQEELATRIGKSRPAISNSLRLMTLPTGVQRRVAANVLSAGHAKALLALPDAATQERVAERIVAEGLSVRAVEELVRLRLLDDPSGASGSSSPSGSGKRRIVAPGLIDLQEDLSDALESRVRITMGARKGKLTIEFASVDDLERIVGVIAGGLESGRDAISMPSEEL